MASWTWRRPMPITRSAGPSMSAGQLVAAVVPQVDAVGGHGLDDLRWRGRPLGRRPAEDTSNTRSVAVVAAVGRRPPSASGRYWRCRRRGTGRAEPNGRWDPSPVAPGSEHRGEA